MNEFELTLNWNQINQCSNDRIDGAEFTRNHQLLIVMVTTEIASYINQNHVSILVGIDTKVVPQHCRQIES